MPIDGEARIWKLKAAHVIAGLLFTLCGMVGWGMRVAYETGASFQQVRDRVNSSANLNQQISNKVDSLEKKFDDAQREEQYQLNEINTRLSRVEGSLGPNYSPHSPPPIIRYGRKSESGDDNR